MHRAQSLCISLIETPINKSSAEVLNTTKIPKIQLCPIKGATAEILSLRILAFLPTQGLQTPAYIEPYVPFSSCLQERKISMAALLSLCFGSLFRQIKVETSIYYSPKVISDFSQFPSTHSFALATTSHRQRLGVVYQI